MPEKVIADTSCLIALHQTDDLFLLRELYKAAIITPQVRNEYVHKIPSWFEVRKIYTLQLYNYLFQILGEGEASVITWAFENPGSIAIIDDLKARKIASKFKIKITGTIGILLAAKSKKIIPAIRPSLEVLKNNGFRMSGELFLSALNLAHEK